MTGAATRVQVVPPEAWDEQRLLNAARGYAASGRPLRPGDAVGDLVVIAVEPAPGAALADDTEIVIVPTPPTTGAAKVDIVALLDVSESMGVPWDKDRTRLEAARSALASFLAAPGPAVVNVTLVEYAKEPRLVDGPAAPSVVQLHDAPKPAGPSRTGRAIDFALEQIVARRSPERASAIFLLTDGVGELPHLSAAAERAGRLKVPIHAVVFAPDEDEAFARIADASGGSAQRAGYPLTIEFEHQPGP